MALVTVQRSPSPSASAETEEQDGVETDESLLKSPRQRSFSESYFTVKGAALILPQSDYENVYARKATKSHGGDIQSHLQAMFSVLRPQDTIKVAVKLEGNHVRYLVVVSCIGRQDTEESVILGIDLRERTSIGLVLPVWAHTDLKLDGDGGFSITSDDVTRDFKPVSVQAMWSALQSLNKVVKIANDNLYIPRGLTHTWVGYYQSKLTDEASILSEWNAMDDIERVLVDIKAVDSEHRKLARMSSNTSTSSTSSCASLSYLSNSSEESIYRRIKTELKLIMMNVDLEEVTCVFLRKEIEKKLLMDLRPYKSFIDEEMLEILGQMDAPSKITDYLYLGSEWNASNLEELQLNGVDYILNVSREIDNFFPGILHYMNVREWDTEISNLMPYWEDTHRYIKKAKKRGSKALVHCKMGISRSASTVMAYLMKENKWSRQEAYDYTKSKRSIINPNTGFWKQLWIYQGILQAGYNREKFNSREIVTGSSPQQLDEVMEEGPYYHSPEDLIAMNLGKDILDEGGLSFMHTEPDIEIGSRSADSTEDSIPDEPSPKPIIERDKGAAGGRRSKQSKSDRSKTSVTSSECLSSDTDLSDYSDSDKLPTDDDDDGKRFRPIELPGFELNLAQDGKSDSLKRRCHSEGDKHSLSVEDRHSSCSREGFLPKIKPDGSWIKLEVDSDAEGNQVEQMDTEQEPVREESESGDAGIWMGEKPGESSTDVDAGGTVVDQTKQALHLAKEEIPSEQIDTHAQDAETDEIIAEGKERIISPMNVTETTDNIEPTTESESDNQMRISGISDHYVKENIPWHPGTVQKQKQDLEQRERAKLTSPHKKSHSPSSVELQAIIDTAKVKEVEQTASEQPLVEKYQESKASNEIEDTKSCDIVIQSDDVEQSATGLNEAQCEMRISSSVYDLEEIDLPQGIVKKTTQEIEERNKLLVDSPKKRVHRTSSLKSRRVTPKAKDRDNERRKTCIAILSPTNTDYTPKDKESSERAVTPECSGDSQSGAEDMNLTDIEMAEGRLNDLTNREQMGTGVGSGTDREQTGTVEGSTREETDMETGSVKVYKFMGEEVTVQQGLVKKQTQDIEKHKTQEAAVTKASSKIDSESTLADHTPTATEDPVKSVSEAENIPSLRPETSSSAKTEIPETVESSKRISDDENSKQSAKESKKEDETMNSASENIDTSHVDKVKKIRATLQEKVSKCEDQSQHSETTTTTTPVSLRRRLFKKGESHFDEETLELIREIGSALLNSPAKTEVEEEEDAPLAGGSLVSHYVRKIERVVKERPTRRKAVKEIVIVDKDYEQKPAKFSSASQCSASSCTEVLSESPNSKVASPKWSPVAKQQLVSQYSPTISSTSVLSESVATGKKSPVTKTQCPATKQQTSVTKQQSPVFKQPEVIQKPDPTNLSLNLSPEFAMETNSETDEIDSDNSEARSVKNLVGKFEKTEPSSGKNTPISGSVLSPSIESSLLPRATKDMEVIEAGDNVACASKPNSSTKQRSWSESEKLHFGQFQEPSGQGQSSQKPHLLHRQSEPIIQLSEKNVKLLTARLRETDPEHPLSTEIMETDEDELGYVTKRGNANRTTGARPKSADHSNHRGQRLSGANSKNTNLHKSRTVHEGEASETFTWEGKKVRKTYGKSHPLTKLEDKLYMDTIRKNPFYNTM